METRVSDGEGAAASSQCAGWSPPRPKVSVIICAYTDDRWSQLTKSVASVEAQTSPPIEIIVCIDHNEEFRGGVKNTSRSEAGSATP